MTDLYSFLEHTSNTSDFKADLSTRGGYITFSNSGRRGGVKYFRHYKIFCVNGKYGIQV